MKIDYYFAVYAIFTCIKGTPFPKIRRHQVATYAKPSNTMTALYLKKSVNRNTATRTAK